MSSDIKDTDRDSWMDGTGWSRVDWKRVIERHTIVLPAVNTKRGTSKPTKKDGAYGAKVYPPIDAVMEPERMEVDDGLQAVMESDRAREESLEADYEAMSIDVGPPPKPKGSSTERRMEPQKDVWTAKVETLKHMQGQAKPKSLDDKTTPPALKSTFCPPAIQPLKPSKYISLYSLPPSSAFQPALAVDGHEHAAPSDLPLLTHGTPSESQAQKSYQSADLPQITGVSFQDHADSLVSFRGPTSRGLLKRSESGHQAQVEVVRKKARFDNLSPTIFRSNAIPSPVLPDLSRETWLAAINHPATLINHGSGNKMGSKTANSQATPATKTPSLPIHAPAPAPAGYIKYSMKSGITPASISDVQLAIANSSTKRKVDDCIQEAEVAKPAEIQAKKKQKPNALFNVNTVKPTFSLAITSFALHTGISEFKVPAFNARGFLALVKLGFTSFANSISIFNKDSLTVSQLEDAWEAGLWAEYLEWDAGSMTPEVKMSMYEAAMAQIHDRTSRTKRLRRLEENGVTSSPVGESNKKVVATCGSDDVVAPATLKRKNNSIRIPIFEEVVRGGFPVLIGKHKYVQFAVRAVELNGHNITLRQVQEAWKTALTSEFQKWNLNCKKGSKSRKAKRRTAFDAAINQMSGSGLDLPWFQKMLENQRKLSSGQHEEAVDKPKEESVKEQLKQSKASNLPNQTPVSATVHRRRIKLPDFKVLNKGFLYWVIQLGFSGFADSTYNLNHGNATLKELKQAWENLVRAELVTWSDNGTGPESKKEWYNRATEQMHVQSTKLLMRLAEEEKLQKSKGVSSFASNAFPTRDIQGPSLIPGTKLKQTAIPPVKGNIQENDGLRVIDGKTAEVTKIVGGNDTAVGQTRPKFEIKMDPGTASFEEEDLYGDSDDDLVKHGMTGAGNSSFTDSFVIDLTEDD